MHIEPEVVEGSRILLSYASAGGALAYTAKRTLDSVRLEGGLSLLLRIVLSTALVFAFFELLPHHPVGVSEVHLILGTTLLLLFGVAPAAIGLVCGLLIQGVFLAPFDLPQFGMNITTLLVPLFVTDALARRIIPARTAYVDISYSQAAKLSLAYQGGIVAWVGFWAVYGQGFTADNLAQIGTFSAAYMSVVIIEPLADLAVLACAKLLQRNKGFFWVQRRLHHPAP